MKLSDSNIKKCLIFRETKTPRKKNIFPETEVFYISGNGNPKKLI